MYQEIYGIAQKTIFAVKKFKICVQFLLTSTYRDIFAGKFFEAYFFIFYVYYKVVWIKYFSIRIYDSEKAIQRK